MAGYLTKAMTLIRMEQILQEQETKLNAKKDRGETLSALEEKLLPLLTETRTYLRPTPSPSGPSFPLTNIEDPAGQDGAHGVGHGLSKYAFTGTLGTDFPAAGYILALHQRWVSRVLRRGAPRRAWVEAGSMRLVYELIDGINRKFQQPDSKRALMSYVIGHCAAIATDVMVQPFLTHQAWKSEPDPDRKRHQALTLALDAKVSHGFFRREDMQAGQDWADYYLDTGDYEEEIQRLMELYFDAFQSTYGGPDPSEPLCGPKADPCVYAKLEKEFLIDGYSNTVNWAIDVGYDQAPWVPRLLWSLILAGAAMYLVYDIWSSTEEFGTPGHTLFDWADDQIQKMRTETLDAWKNDKLDNHRIWLQMLDSSYSLSGYLTIAYSLLLTGIPVIWSDGMFGQGTQSLFDRSAGLITYKIIKIVVSVTNFVLAQPFPKVFKGPVLRWLMLTKSVVLDMVDFFHTNTRSEEKGLEGYIVDRALYLPTIITSLFFFVSAMFVFGLKADRDEDTGSGLDYLLGSFVPIILIAMVADTGLYDTYLVEKVVGVQWPDGKSDDINFLLKVETTNAVPAFKPAGGAKASVQFFPDSALAEADGKKHFPQAAEGTAFAERATADENARREASTASPKQYHLDKLIERAAQLAGMLAMGAVNYSSLTDAAAKEKAKKVFDDWNLDYRTEKEWQELMETVDGRSGLLEATERFWNN